MVPSLYPTARPSLIPSIQPSVNPSFEPSGSPSTVESNFPSIPPSLRPSFKVSSYDTVRLTSAPTMTSLEGSTVASTGLIGAMTATALLFVGFFFLQFIRNKKRVDNRSEEEEVVLNLEIDPGPIISAVSGEDSINSHPTQVVTFGVPSFIWGGLDNGRRIKGECRVGVEDTIPTIVQSDSFT